MAISTYSELQSAAANWLARDDLTARIPEFVTLCEAKLNRELFVRQMEVRSTTTCDTSDTEPEFISLPTDFQSMRRIRLSSVTGKPRLRYLSGTQADEYRYGNDNTSGQPSHFTIMGSEIELIPTPDANYTIEMVYRKNIPALASNSTNWLLTLAPDVYLYGTLLESAPYIKEDERIAVWAAGLSQAVESLNKLGQLAQYNSGPMTMTVSGVTP
ncbi:hypothetical protein V1290_000053 [Bradyrhizobium sp. AZCC 1578]|uniref:phage adaptor protein n=1 Tax=Bradyrhizobium sp. AZCC 1578 TaxID=3117027 RepID=UPI002FEE7214